MAEKKRRLNVDQVKALEKNFEVENKLDPERKVKLAQELSLQPRQVAVWFQNRRARWKTKQLERDYGVLKASYEALKLNYDDLCHDKEALLDELRELKSKFSEETTEINHSIKEEIVMSEFENEVSEADKISEAAIGGGSLEKNHSNRDCSNGDFKDGSEDSDSSAILNDETSPRQLMTLISPSSSINFLQFDSRVSSSTAQKAYYQFMRTEDHSFLNAEETCNLFSDDHPWFCMEQWNYSM
eukprot:TRINITY_DN546_c0_g2_i3.p1 TRINITY_DN546_c0_g2~~TRINITY_DN546_c0_g2_i3.p1  ORF type:complete len:242 (-),score=40.99 TRINITY_DN546_c0_g2_i3:138-863(-)